MNKSQRDELIAKIRPIPKSNAINSAIGGQWQSYIKALKAIYQVYGRQTMIALHENVVIMCEFRQIHMPNLEAELETLDREVEELSNLDSGTFAVTLPSSKATAACNQPTDTELEIHPSSVRSEVVNFMGSMANMIATHKEEMETLQNDCYDAIQSMITSSSELAVERATAFNEFNLNVQRAIAKASAVASNNDKHGFVMPLPSNEAAHVALRALLRNANPMHAGKAIRELAMNADTEAYALLVMVIKEIGREPEFSKYIKAGKR